MAHEPLLLGIQTSKCIQNAQVKQVTGQPGIVTKLLWGRGWIESWMVGRGLHTNPTLSQHAMPRTLQVITPDSTTYKPSGFKQRQYTLLNRPAPWTDPSHSGVRLDCQDYH